MKRWTIYSSRSAPCSLSLCQSPPKLTLSWSGKNSGRSSAKNWYSCVTLSSSSTISSTFGGRSPGKPSLRRSIYSSPSWRALRTCTISAKVSHLSMKTNSGGAAERAISGSAILWHSSTMQVRHPQVPPRLMRQISWCEAQLRPTRPCEMVKSGSRYSSAGRTTPTVWPTWAVKSPSRSLLTLANSSATPVVMPFKERNISLSKLRRFSTRQVWPNTTYIVSICLLHRVPSILSSRPRSSAAIENCQANKLHSFYFV